MQRPTSVLVISILNICFAGIGILATCAGLVSIVPVLAGQGGPPAIIELWRDSVPYRVQVILGTPIGLALLGLLLAGAIGMLQGLAWGRLLTIIWAIASMILTPINTVFTVLVVVPVTLRHTPPPPNLPPQLAGMMQALMIVGAGCGFVLSVGYAILVVALLNRAVVKAYFRGEHVEPVEPWNA